MRLNNLVFYKHWLFLLMTKVLFAVVLHINHTFIGGSFRAHIGKQRKANEVEKLTMWRIHSGSGCTQFLIRRLIIPLLTHDMVYALKFALDFAFIRFMQSEIYARKEKREKMQKISFSSNSSLVGIAKHHSTTKKGLPTYICKIKEVKMTKFFQLTPREEENIGQILTLNTECPRAILLWHSVASWTR